MSNSGSIKLNESLKTISSTTVSEVYVNNYKWLVNMLNKKLSCPQKSADLAQDTFIRILSSQNIFYISEAKAILTTISKGLLVDYYRRQTIEATYRSALTYLPEAQTPSPEEKAIVLDTLFEIDRMLDCLPSKARTVFLLSQLDGLTYPEIAEKLNISLSSVQKHMTQTFLACYAIRYQGDK
ncbi:sigma-70 family RNA polymerase sigma factor [Methylotenera sp. 1P/1]|uniref:sigma-70 family RNA polymerase sigma factor n=1 Tax=Methylotenera sp. 1P/1 TaxID=1131551 RepID=UPI00036772B8|nr:sigma-70 family RNA polymerase sigma factor [Methylotenera sp. 1P/1]